MFGTAQASRLEAIPIRAPVGGINSVAALAGMDPGDCIFLENLIPSAYGLKTRLGAQAWNSTAIGTGGAKEVRTLMGFQGANPANNKLFATCSDGIYDITTSGAAPTRLITFGVTTGLAGYGNWISYSTVADHYGIYCDELNGMYVYPESTGTWVKFTLGTGANQISNVDPATFTYCRPWQNRLWFCQANSGIGWYLGVGAIQGPATAWPFGSNFTKGGALRCLANWTVDGGSGVENNLIAIGSSGDVSVYTGTDPAQAGQGKFTLVGTWTFSGLPAGRNITLDHGGDVLLTTAWGLISVSKLLQGSSLVDRSIYETRKIDNLFALEYANNGGNPGWSLGLSPDEASIIISVPQLDGTYLQYAMNYQTRGWGKLIGRQSHAIGLFNNHLYFGDGNGQVWIAQGGQDSVSTSGTGGQAINWMLFSAFNELGTAFQVKRPAMCIPSLLSGNQALGWNVFSRFDFNLDTNTPLPSLPPAAGSVWDVGLWDVATWGGNSATFSKYNGLTGWGRWMALIMRGISSSPTTLNNIDLFYEMGGPV